MEKDSHAQRNYTKSYEISICTFENVKKTDTGSWKLLNKSHRCQLGYLPSELQKVRHPGILDARKYFGFMDLAENV